jgi:hypothetical protein
MMIQNHIKRILLIEDDPGRIDLLRSWMPDHVRIVVAAKCRKRPWECSRGT